MRGGGKRVNKWKNEDNSGSTEQFVLFTTCNKSSFSKLVGLYNVGFKGLQGLPFHPAPYPNTINLPKQPDYITSQRDTHPG